ncbi:hypothetical protein KVR01_009190 [Diaporthe batatas]|uniref:uncharacterized protein n=1 Tax=Diaporthe batatas TaxID=748121 RepID=UPI001D048644|nr:uncharacterized protein KVR01_009190 [Diaporthe batatas]KAG8160926.1 hypothetical protein KVR01_009190 [Diaporthe batatas]
MPHPKRYMYVGAVFPADLVAKVHGTCARDEHSTSPEGLGLITRQVVEDYSCDENRPCKNGACCAKTGFCGFGPESCGTNDQSPNDKCWSNCDAHAECGRYAEEEGKKCPLNVCCSQHGFCGTTSEFCEVTEDEKTSCQSNCEQPGSGGSGGDVQKRIIGYYEAWNHKKTCIGMPIQDIPVGSITHLYYSFGYIQPETYDIITMVDEKGQSPPESTFTELTELKKQNSALKVIVALGGWTFNDNNTIWQPVFSDIVSTEEKRSRFITKLMFFLTRAGFDGVDIDWEYPGAPDRGGHPDDGVNFTKLLQEMRTAFNKMTDYKEISFTAPTSYWYLRWFDIKASAEAVDFVNVMAYDLHGIWDATNPIGNQVLAHTNLTEIGLALDLFWRNEVDPGKLNLGLGFYGRSFQLADPSCHQPGCLFKGGASKGPCTDNSGTLSYREIMDIIEQNSLSPYYDTVNAVKYITWGADQWVSYDDFDTFQQKIEFANGLGLGGLLIWAIDLDTPDLDALSAVIYPEQLGARAEQATAANNWEDADGGHCRVTDCGYPDCNAGEIQVTTQQCEDMDWWDGSYAISGLCCPMSSAPKAKDCAWRGNPEWCNGQCHKGEVALQSSFWGDGDKCWDGRKFYCCPAEAQQPDCRWTGCNESCNNDESELTWMYGSCPGEQKLKFCCDKDQGWKNCKWHGKAGNCFDNHCDTGWQVALTVQDEGEGDDCGILKRKRSFCCDPKDGESPFLPVPLEYLFPEPPKSDNVDTDFELKVDPTYGGTNDVPFNEDPKNSPFGFVVLASPEELQVSLDKRDGSHWEVFDCFDGITEGQHTVRMVCTDTSENSNCGKIHLGHGAPGTIVEMPRGCGPGKYAVVKDLTVSQNQGLPHHLVKRGLVVNETAAPVHDLTFDYDFRRVPRDLGSTQIRIDFSNEPEYWNNVVNKPGGSKKNKRSLEDVGGSHKRWLEEEWRDDYHFGGLSQEDLHKRWFGEDVISWLSGLINGVSGGLDLSHTYSEKIVVKLVDEHLTCPNLAAKLEIKAETSIDVDTNYGFTLIATLDNLNLDFSNSYLYFRNKGKVEAKFIVDAAVTVRFDTQDVMLLSADKFGAAFSVPGIVTVGPNFKVLGRLEAEATLGVKLESQVVLAEWDTKQTYPVANNNWNPEASKSPKKDGTQSVLDPTFEYGLRLEGQVTAHVKPVITFGIEFNKDLISIDPVAVNLVADGWVRFHADFETGSSGTSFCYGVDAGADIYATIDAPSAFSWALPSSPFPIIPIDTVQIYPPEGGDKCWSPSKRALPELDDGHDGVGIYTSENGTGYYEARTPSPQYFSRRRSDLIAERSLGSHSKLDKRAQVYGPLVPHLTGLRCPGQIQLGDIPPCPLCTGDEEDAAGLTRREDENICVLERDNVEAQCSAGSSKARRDGQDGDHVLVKRTTKTLKWRDHLGVSHTLSCGPYPSCDDAKGDGQISKWWGYEIDKTQACPVEISRLTRTSVGFVQGDYATDHVYEANFITAFLEFLINGPLPAGYTAATRQWVSEVLVGVPTTANAVQIDNADSLFFDMTRALGGNGGGKSRLALLYGDINSKKRAFMQLNDVDQEDRSSNLASRRLHRNTYGVFSYMKQDIIWQKFVDSSQLIENSLTEFDNTYNWGSVGGEIGRPTNRGANQPAAGLRDLYCYWVDRQLNSIEAKADNWVQAARTKYESRYGGEPRGIDWLATEFNANTGTIRSANLRFPASPGGKHGLTGGPFNSDFRGLWTGQAGPW